MVSKSIRKIKIYNRQVFFDYFTFEIKKYEMIIHENIKVQKLRQNEIN